MRLRCERCSSGDVLRMRWVGGNSPVAVEGMDQLASSSNYIVGGDPSKWRTRIPHFRKVRLRSVYEGIDLVFHGSRRAIEYDFVVEPGADPSTIQVDLDGARDLRIQDGDLVVVMGAGVVTQRKPVTYQVVDGRRRDVDSKFVVRRPKTIGFAVGAYDPRYPLVIDPVLDYSTYLGGTLEDSVAGVAVDGSAHAYVTGYTLSVDFPVAQDALQPVNRGSADGFISKLSSDGSKLLYSTYFGGSHLDHPEDVEVDSGGHAYITGHTYSRDFPVTAEAFQRIHGGANTDGFVMKLHPNGSKLMYSTYLGGSGEDRGSDITNDYADRAFLAGRTTSLNFPVTPNAFQPVNRGSSDAFVTQFENDGSVVVFSSYLGGPGAEHGMGISVDPDGDTYVGGDSTAPGFPTTADAFQPEYRGGPSDGFITKVRRDGTVLLYSTYLGGTHRDFVYKLQVSRFGEAYATGATESPDFPTTPNAIQPVIAGGRDAFVTKMNRAGTAPEFSTFLGGTGFDDGTGIDLDGPGNAYVSGRTLSPNFPVTPDAFQPVHGGSFDGVVAKINKTGSLLIFSSFLGGTLADGDRGVGVAVETATSFFVTGRTSSVNFPVTPGVFQPVNRGSYDTFVAKIGHVPGTAAAVMVEPLVGATSVSSTHCVRATATDVSGNGTPGVEVSFAVTGLNRTSGVKTTNANAQAEFCYSSAPLAGSDVITAYLDTDRDQTFDVGEPSEVAQVTWIVP